MRSVKVEIKMTRADGQHVTRTLDVSAGKPVIIDDADEVELDASAENEIIAAHLDAALSAERLADWLDDLDELP